jgi:hypothetical protein
MIRYGLRPPVQRLLPRHVCPECCFAEPATPDGSCPSDEGAVPIGDPYWVSVCPALAVSSG